MLNTLTTKAIKITFIIGSIFIADFAAAQYPEYRITDEGQYQYLGNSEMAQTVLDETQGTYYKPITSKTFFFHAQAKNLLPSGMEYKDFMQLSVKEQQALLAQTQYRKPLDCSIGAAVPERCIVYKPAPSPAIQNGFAARRVKIDLNNQLETLKVILHHEE